MQKLTHENRRRAEAFLIDHARPLEAALYQHTRRGSADAARAELAAFRYDGGGYGCGLEPDAQHPGPSVLDTTMALEIHRRLDTAVDHPQVREAIAYLRAAYDAPNGVWPIRPACGPDTPSAPWWKSASDAALVAAFEGCRLNPTADVLALFLRFGTAADATLIVEVTERVRTTIDSQSGPLGMHDLLCVSRLSRAPGLNEALRDFLIDRVARDLATVVSPDPGTWTGYGLKPWWIAETPGDPRLADLAPGLLDAMLDHEVARQSDDGGWPPFWDWGGLHPGHWPAARTAWAGVLTEQNLRVFGAFGRL